MNNEETALAVQLAIAIFFITSWAAIRQCGLPAIRKKKLAKLLVLTIACLPLFAVTIFTFTTLRRSSERRLTKDGGPKILNGRLDWVYQEELYGRGNFEAYWWSPDSTKLAYLRFDENPVHEFTVVDHIPYPQALEVTPYPRAGEPNPIVQLGVVKAAGGETQWIDTSEISTKRLSDRARVVDARQQAELHIRLRTASRRSWI